MDLDPAVLQAYGLGPPPVDAGMGGSASPDAGYGDLHPVVAQAFGLAPLAPPTALQLPAAPPSGTDATSSPAGLAPLTPTTLPSMAAPAPAAVAPGRPDYQVSPAQFGQQQPAKPVAQAKPAKPATPQQLEQEARAKQATADQQSAVGIAQQQDVATQTAQQNLAAAEQHAAAAKQIEEQRAALADDIKKTRAQKQAYVDATMNQVDNYKVDFNKFAHEQGIGDMIGWGIATALSAVGDALQHKTGPNAVIQMMQARMHEAVQAQLDEREQLKEKGQRAGHALDKYDAFSKDRQAQMDMLDARNDRWLAQQVALTGAKMADPQARANAQQQYAALMQSSAEKSQKAADTATNHDIQLKHVQVAGAQASETRRHNLVEEGWQKAKFEEEQMLKAAALAAKASGKLGDEESKRALFDPNTKQPLRNSKGDLVLGGSAEIAQKTRDMIAGATSYNRLVNQMSRAIAEHGGESTWIKGKEWQKMESDLQSATAELHDAYGITAFREPTVKFFEKMASAGVDPTSFVRDATGALQESNMNLQAKVNEKLNALGYDGAEIKWADTSNPPAPVQTPEDIALKVAMGSRGDDPGAIRDPATGNRILNTPGAPVDPDYQPRPSDSKPTSKDLEVEKRYPTMGSGQRAVVEMWAASLQSSDPQQRDRAAAILGQLANEADEKGVRDYASQILLNNVMPNEGGTVQPTPPAPAAPPLHPDVAKAFGLQPTQSRPQ